MDKFGGIIVNILIPMAGLGSRFSERGYSLPKPLINVSDTETIIDISLGCFYNKDFNYIFIVRKEHCEEYNIDKKLKNIVPKCNIIEIDYLTDGQACSALLGEQYFDNDDPLFIANSDNYFNWDFTRFITSMKESTVDASVVTIEDDTKNTAWSYAKIDEEGFITETAEKKPISNHALVGCFYWKIGSDFVKYTNQMIDKDIRTNNEFYIAPVYNEAIKDNKKCVIYNIEGFKPLGTPEELDDFLKWRLQNEAT
tara:strand:- start:215 stop:976 length:762 start_codon:yes stop_codon:yes gene_type:complete